MHNVVRGLIFAGLAFVLFACSQTTNKSFVELKSQEDAIARGEKQAGFCPKTEILEGTGILSAYANAQEKPENLSHQAVIVRANRKCTIVDNQLKLAIASAVRVSKGPKLVDEQVVLPIRIVVLRGEGDVLHSELYNRPVFLGANEVQEFTVTENSIVLPADNLEGTKILMGFDTLR